MAVITATDSLAGLAGYVNACISSALRSFAVDYWPPHHADVGVVTANLTLTRVAATAHPRVLSAVNDRSYMDDYYYRVHVRPQLLALGNVVSEQVRESEIWNAWPARTVTINQIDVPDGVGVELSGQPPLPLTFQPLQSRTWAVTIAMTGSSSIDIDVAWNFTDTQIHQRITGNRALLWVWRPNWAEGILETLEWRTDIISAEQDTEQRISMRDTPRQTWEFTTDTTDRERQTMVNKLIGMTLHRWSVPQWPHGVDLDSYAPAGTNTLNVSTVGRPFAVGDLVMILDDENGANEAAEVAALTSATITTKLPLTKSWRAGIAVVYPAPASIIDDGGELEHFTGAADEIRIRFMTDEPVPHAATLSMPTYRGIGVLEDAPDWSTAPTLTPGRSVATVDNTTSLPIQFDRAGVPLLKRSMHLTPTGRANLDRVRSLQYLLRGARGALWIPALTIDLTLAAQAPAGAVLLSILECGYSESENPTMHRQDIRIESASGILYRRIMTAASNGVTEALNLDAVLPYNLSPEPGATRISFMALWRQDSDRNEWNWWSGDMGADQATADVPVSLRTFSHDL